MNIPYVRVQTPSGNVPFEEKQPQMDQMRIKYDPVARDLQRRVCDILNSEPQLSGKAEFFPEQSLEIEYEVRKNLRSQGLAAIVMTPTLTNLGHDGVCTAWQCDDLTLRIVENPPVNRDRLKKAGLSSGTALDIAEIAAERLAGPQGGLFGDFCTRDIKCSENGGLLVVNAVFKTTCSRQLSGLISSDGEGSYAEVPFASRQELEDLSAAVLDVSASFEGFSTEEIKEGMLELGRKVSELETKTDGLSDVYQPKGDYLTEKDLGDFALKTEIPTKTSQLTNDSGYLTDQQVDLKDAKTLEKANAYSDQKLSEANAYTDEVSDGIKSQTA